MALSNSSYLELDSKVEYFPWIEFTFLIDTCTSFLMRKF